MHCAIVVIASGNTFRIHVIHGPQLLGNSSPFGQSARAPCGLWRCSAPPLYTRILLWQFPSTLHNGLQAPQTYPQLEPSCWVAQASHLPQQLSETQLRCLPSSQAQSSPEQKLKLELELVLPLLASLGLESQTAPHHPRQRLPGESALLRHWRRPCFQVTTTRKRLCLCLAWSVWSTLKNGKTKVLYFPKRLSVPNRLSA